ncbi:hypothetical protein HN51_010571 [Arachis hypogaea]
MLHSTTTASSAIAFLALASLSTTFAVHEISPPIAVLYHQHMSPPAPAPEILGTSLPWNCWRRCSAASSKLLWQFANGHARVLPIESHNMAPYGFLLENVASQYPLSVSVAILHQFNILPEMYQVGIIFITLSKEYHYLNHVHGTSN